MKSESNFFPMSTGILRTHGFTLLELLLAIFIFSIVITTVYGSYRSTFHNIQGAESQAEAEEMALVIMDRVQADLESTFGGEGGFMEGEQVDMGGMVGAHLSFTSTAHVRFSRKAKTAGVTVLTYSTTENEETGFLDLYRLDQPIRPKGEEDVDDKSLGELLGANLREFRIIYINEEGDEQESWLSESEEEKKEGETTEVQLPAMIRVELRFGTLDEDTSQDRVFSSGAAILPGRAVTK